MKKLANSLYDSMCTSALKLTSSAIVELFERSPRLREMFMAKSYLRYVDRLARAAPANQFRMLDIAPVVHRCVDPLCTICVRKRVEVN